MKLSLKSVEWNLRDEANTAEMELFSDLNRTFGIDGLPVSCGRFCNTLRVVNCARHYYVKLYKVRGGRFWKGLGPGRSVSEYRNLTYFARLGLPVPKIVGYGRERLLGLFLRGAIITEEIPKTIDFQAIFRTRADLWQSRPWLFQALRLIADYVRRLHEAGFTHGDLKWRNILATTTDPPGVFFIDCPNGSRKWLFRRTRLIVKDLAGLDRSAAQYLSRTTRLRFYLWYRSRIRLNREDRGLIVKIVNFGGKRHLER
jgi:tRNA A-37 threonylcarbamoyl transferase component Bud32